jgi:2-keto-4-pentenoate hydratase/2-oxohepta-3-ene-1,7-dioic acid hydratase in catechol pathway
MRLVSFDIGGQPRLGVQEGDEVIDLQAIDPRFPADVRVLLADGNLGLESVRRLADKAGKEHVRPLAGLDLALPVRTPGKVICLGLNYHDHAKEGGNVVAAWPAIFLRTLSSLVAAGHPMIVPDVSIQLDYEAEMVAVIGRRTRHATLSTALDAITGYSCFNDGSVRDYQRHTTQWTLGKNFDATGAFGPSFVTADELPPGARGLAIECRLNGAVMQHDNTDNMVFPVAETVVIVSKAMTLEPGDLLVMGTPAGVGYARKPPVFMKDGDVVEIEIERVGVLRNPVRQEPLVRTS